MPRHRDATTATRLPHRRPRRETASSVYAPQTPVTTIRDALQALFGRWQSPRELRGLADVVAGVLSVVPRDADIDGPGCLPDGATALDDNPDAIEVAVAPRVLAICHNSLRGVLHALADDGDIVDAGESCTEGDVLAYANAVRAVVLVLLVYDARIRRLFASDNLVLRYTLTARPVDGRLLATLLRRPDGALRRLASHFLVASVRDTSLPDAAERLAATQAEFVTHATYVWMLGGALPWTDPRDAVFGPTTAFASATAPDSPWRSINGAMVDIAAAAMAERTAAAAAAATTMTSSSSSSSQSDSTSSSVAAESLTQLILPARIVQRLGEDSPGAASAVPSADSPLYAI